MPSAKEWTRIKERMINFPAEFTVVSRAGDLDAYRSAVRKLREAFGGLNVADAGGWGAPGCVAVFVRGKISRVVEVLTPERLAKGHVHVFAANDASWFTTDGARGAFKAHEAREAKKAAKAKRT